MTSGCPHLPPKPPSRPERVSLWAYAKLFRADILSAQPAKLYRAWMAEFRTPFFRSFLINQPELIRTVLKERPDDFPKSNRIAEGLRPLLGESVFLTNGAQWKRQRRIIDPALEGGRLRDTFPSMHAAALACVGRLTARAGEVVEIEEETSHAAADVIFRTLFSIPIEHQIASDVFHEFRRYQKSKPILNIAAFLPLPRWIPRGFSKETRRSARKIWALIQSLTRQRQDAILEGTAPDDLATKIMTTVDPQTGAGFDAEEMVDQVAIFFLAGHETSASALGWALYLMALYPECQECVADEAKEIGLEDFSSVARLKIARDVFRETLRLYPPVPMMVREAACPETFRERAVPEGAQIVISPWHLHRHERLWENPDAFQPERWQGEEGRGIAREAWIPFSAGSRVCTGAGFAMIEGPLLLAAILRELRVELAGDTPRPVAHLTVRSANGIHLKISRR